MSKLVSQLEEDHAVEPSLPSPSKSSKAGSMLPMISVSNNEVGVRDPDVSASVVALDILSVSEPAIDAVLEYLIVSVNLLSEWRSNCCSIILRSYL